MRMRKLRQSAEYKKHECERRREKYNPEERKKYRKNWLEGTCSKSPKTEAPNVTKAKKKRTATIQYLSESEESEDEATQD